LARLTNCIKIEAKLTNSDLQIFIILSIQISIPDTCLLLNMNKNTLYNRRKTIKLRLGLDADTDLDKWVNDYMTYK